MNRYGIFSPTLGLKQDFAVMLLQEAYTPDCSNIQIVNGEIRRAKMRAALLAALPAPAIQMHWLEKTSGEGYLFAFTETGIWRWDTATTDWVTWLGAGESALELSATTHWSAVTFNNRVIATNGIDKVIVFDDATPAAWLGGANGVEMYAGKYCTAAHWVAVFENCVFLIRTTEDGVQCNQRIRWSSIGDEETWDSLGAGAADVAGSDFVVAAQVYKDFLIVVKEASVKRLWMTGGDLLFAISSVSEEFGCISPHSMVTGMDGELYMLATDKTIRSAQGVEVSQSINETLRQIPDNMMDKVRACKVDAYQELWFAIPKGSDATANTTVMTLKAGPLWLPRQMDAAAFCRFRSQTSYTIDSLPFTTVDGWAWDSIDSVEANARFPMDIVADSAGVIYQSHASNQDKGQDVGSYFTLTTTLGTQDMGLFKRVLLIELLVGNDPGTLYTVEAQEDQTGIWQQVGAAAVIDGQADIHRLVIPTDLRAKHLLLKISCSSPFRFLGVMFEFTPDGGW